MQFWPGIAYFLGALAFMEGVAYVVECKVAHGPHEPPVGHHANIFFTYMQVCG